MVNKNRNCVFDGPYAGRDLHITMYQDSEREFVVTHNTNIKPVSYFTGRELELQELRQRVEEGRKSVLVSGMGGIGKTHICRKLFEEYLNKHAEDDNCPFRHIGYIEYSKDMGSSLQNCLKFKQQNSPEQNQGAAWKELEYLASDGKLLLFVDNVDKTIEEDPGLQRLKGIPGAVVLTSRQTSFSDEFEPYRIGFLGMELCKEIYEKIRFKDSSKKVDLEDIKDLEYIIENLAGRHTITVELLAHLACTKIWTVKRLREELEQKGFRLSFRKNGELVNIQESYEVLYDLSALTEAEQNILEAFSVFPYVPLAAEACNEWLLADAGVSEDADILMGLYQKGWLQFDVDQESFALHPVFAQFIFDKCKPISEKHSELIEACQQKLLIRENDLILECQKYIPFVENIIEKIIMDADEKRIELVDSLVHLLMYIGEYEKIRKLQEKNLEIYEEELGENNQYLAKIYYTLAIAYAELGQYKKAEKFGKKSLEMFKDIYGEGHRNTADAYNNLAGIYIYVEDYDESKVLLKKSIQILENANDKDEEENLTLSYSYNVLANVYKEMGEYGEAERLLGKSLNIRKNILGEIHLDVAVIYNNLAGIYYRQGEYQKAEDYYKKSLQIRESILGEKNVKTANVYHNLSVLYRYKGEYQIAMKMCNKALRIWKKTLGDQHPKIAYCYADLAKIYEEKGECEKAIRYYLKAYKICVVIFGINNFHTQDVYRNMYLLWSRINVRWGFSQWLKEKMKE